MPKAKKKTAKKRTVICGTCDEEGHNARTCPTTADKKEIKSSADIPPPPVKTKIRVDTQDEGQGQRLRRDAPTAGNTIVNNYSPYRCKKCTQVAVLIAVRVKDYMASHKKGKDIWMSETRCEQCFNKPPADLILKWGVTPEEVVPIPGQDA